MTTTGGALELGRGLRDTLGRYATGVAIITASDRGRRAGLTVNSFTSVSLDPPLVLWCLNETSSTWAVFSAAGHFAVHVLAAEQNGLALAFARPGDRFAGAPVEPGPYDLPLLSGAIATLVCRREKLIHAGDHLVLIGEVIDHRMAAGVPLLFVDGSFRAGPLTERARRPARGDLPAARSQQPVVPLIAGKPG